MRPSPVYCRTRLRTRLSYGLLAGGLLAAAAAPSAYAQTLPAYSVVQNFNGGFFGGSSGNNNDRFIPPDTMGAVGTTQFGELINGGYAVYSKTDSLVSMTTDQQFWNNAGLTAAASPGVFDPRIQYDSSSGHWFAAELANALGSINNQLLVAVSNSADLTAGFKGYAFNTYSGTSQNFFADFDTLGVNSSGVYVGLNNFSSSGNFASTSVLAVDKASLISGASSTPASDLFYNQDPNTTGFAPHPVSDTSGSSTEYVLGDYNTPAGYQTLSTITGTTATLNGGGPNIAVTGYNGPPAATQQGTTATIDSGDTRYSGGVVKVGTIIYGLQTVQDPASQLSALRLVGIDTAQGNATVLDQLIGSPTLNYYEPSLAINASGQAVIGFSSSGAGQYASSDAIVGQLNSAGTAITLSGPTTLASGLGTYDVTFGGTENRWGDYSSTTLDPTDPTKFWTIQEYASGTNQWSTQISEIGIAGPSAAPEPSQTAGLGFAALGVLGLTLRARRRKAVEAGS